MKYTNFTFGILLSGFTSFIFSAPLPEASPNSQGFNPGSVKLIDQFFEQEIQKNRMPGAVFAVAKNGKLIIYKNYGYLDKNKNIPMTKDAIFNLASMTKVMAAAGALTFYEEGKLQLSAPVYQWFPEFKNMTVGKVENGNITPVPVIQPITIQDLMRHTNGLTYGGRGATPVHKLFPGSSVDAATQYNSKEFLDKLASTPLLFEPGTTWDYGFGIDVLGLVQEKIAGKRLNDILNERIWSRLGMKDTSFSLSESVKARLAQPLDIDPITGKNQSIPIYGKKVYFDCAGSCAYSTAGDYIRFGQMLLNGGSLDGQRILGPETVALMTSDHLGNTIKNNVGITEPGRVGYGFGLGVAVRKEKGLSASNGNIGDYTWNGANGTIFWVDPKEKLVVVMMAAAPGELRKEYRERVNALVYGGLNH
ncbi:MAG: serine hydrolase domain-containing protein [Betaproteobacteria bacterium]